MVSLSIGEGRNEDVRCASAFGQRLPKSESKIMLLGKSA
jgi:hypothetical protein